MNAVACLVEVLKLSGDFRKYLPSFHLDSHIVLVLRWKFRSILLHFYSLLSGRETSPLYSITGNLFPRIMRMMNVLSLSVMYLLEEKRAL